MSAHKAEEATFEPAWFAGYDPRFLRRAPSERNFANGLGGAVLVLACASGFTVCIAVAYMLQVPPSHVWWIGAAWIIIVCGIERIVLQLPTKNRRLLPLVLLPRVLVALMVAVVFSEPLVLRFNQGEINDYLSKAKTAEARGVIASAGAFYGPRINADQGKIAQINASRTALANRAEKYRFKSRCEFNTPSCSDTHKPGCATVCEHDARVAAKDAARLAAREPENRARIAALRADIGTLKTKQATQEKEQAAGIGENGGLLAREEALSGLEQKHSAARREVWFLRLLFLCLDLLPLSVKLVRLLADDESPYDAICSAERKHDGLDALEVQENVRVRKDGITVQAQADIEVHRHRIWLDADRRMAATKDEAYTVPGKQHARRYAEPVPALSLDEFSKQTTDHERKPVPVPSALRQGGLVGLVLLGVTVLTSVLLQSPTGLWIGVAALAFAAALALYTRGFRLATARGLRAIFAVLIAGLLIPIMIIIANL